MSQHRVPLTRDRIIEAALRLVDSQGLGRLTMRRLGDLLEVEAMAIYHHLPRGKEELLDGLISHVAMLPLSPTARGEWRPRVHAWAHAYRERLIEHSGVLPLLVTRRTPAALASTTRSVHEVLRGAEVADATTAAHTLVAYVLGHTALEVRGRAGRTAEDERVDWDARFGSGLDLVFAGIAAVKKPATQEPGSANTDAGA